MPTPPPAVVAAVPDSPAPPAPPATVQLGGSCDELSAAYVKECQDKPSSCADTSSPVGTASFSAILNEGAFLTSCKSPPSTAVKICAAIRRGHALGVTVTTTPGDERLSTCIGKEIQSIDFPASPRLDVASTVFRAQ